VTKKPEVKTVTATKLRTLAVKAKSLAEAFEREAESANPADRAQIFIWSGLLRRHAEQFAHYAAELPTGKTPPRATRERMQWVINKLWEYENGRETGPDCGVETRS
jgi:acyl-CoA reductase-like NAD-dependent aldehyde dehydrogenase